MYRLIGAGVCAVIISSALLPQSHAKAANTVTKVQYDVPYVPTPQEVVDRMLKVADVKSSDYVIDLGSGDGRIVLTAVQKYGARGMGVDLDPDHIASSNKAAQEAGVADRARFVKQDLFKTDLSKASVVTMYLLPSVNLELRPRLLSELKPGTRVVSHSFDMDDWKPDQEIVMESGSTIYYWVIPAKVQGTWSAKLGPKSKPMQLSLKQTYQQVSGTARVDGSTVPLTNVKLTGDRISFALPSGQHFTGTINGSTIEGTSTMPVRATASGAPSAKLNWRATRS